MQFKIIPFIENFRYTSDNELCKFALDSMFANAANDPLGKNYSPKNLKLNEMVHYSFVFDSDNEPEHAAGCQRLSPNVVRVFSRYYVYPKYRNAGKHLLDKNDDFIDLKYWLPKLKSYKLIIWSREFSAGFFYRIKNARQDLFKNWHVYDYKIPIRTPNNYQYIFYLGNIEYIKEIDYRLFK